MRRVPHAPSFHTAQSREELLSADGANRTIPDPGKDILLQSPKDSGPVFRGPFRREQAVPFERDLPEGILGILYKYRLLGSPSLDGIPSVGNQSAGSLASLTRFRIRVVGIGTEAQAFFFPG